MPYRTKRWAGYALTIILIFGCFGAFRVSYSNFIGDHCPKLFSIPACYIVLISYASMALAVFLNLKGSRRTMVFMAGWLVATLIALYASVTEYSSGGGVCPSSTFDSLEGLTLNVTLPLCYASLAILVVVLMLFRIVGRKKTMPHTY